MKKLKFSRYLKAFDFKTLFNELGWDHFDNTLPVAINDTVFQLQGIVQKKGFVILHCLPDQNGAVPLSGWRKKIEHKVTQAYFEHLIIYTDAAQSRQVWQLALVQEGQPKRIREISYYIHQDSEALFQRLKGLLFTLDEEERITLVDVKARVMANLARNVEKITKKFYNEFKKQHAAFLEFIEGIDDALPTQDNKNKQWYASLMLNRLMFCYFIQKKGYLDQDLNYLQNKLLETREKTGRNRFHNFYRRFLLQLFHEGLGKPDAKRQVTVSLGRIPFLNGGLFEVHELEKQFTQIRIQDAAFERIFTFFDQWNWHLDTRIQAAGKDINPDVIGYIFEKYINDRASMGAYYTKEDITEYISKNCIIPFLCDHVKRSYAKPFKPDGEIWKMLRDSGDAYIYDAVKKGAPLPLPDAVAQGLDTSAPHLAERRCHWNTPAPEEFALPTEIWRETVERRQRYADVRAKIDQGAVTTINDFITYNLNIRQFVQDIIENTQDAALIRHFYKALCSITVLDPTCGSGAFLFAALNILEPLYEGCLQRMEQFTEEAPKKHRFFENTLETVNAPDHPNREYFIYKSVILNNLYGVDIMKEAAEIAKLRLFLKMVASVDMNPRLPNYGLEPLPDIDFNIRSGNTLVGFATEKELTEGIKIKDPLFADKTIDAFKERFGLVAQAFERFKDAQLIEDAHSDNFKAAKQEVSERLHKLNARLNTYLASVYNIDPQRQPKKYRQWLESHQPFHWFAEFYSIVADRGGFDVIIGNPPYVEYKNIKSYYQIVNYLTHKCGNLFAYVLERNKKYLHKHSYSGMIIPLSAFSTDRMIPLIEFMTKSSSFLHISNFSWRPGKLFEGVNLQLSILLQKIGNTNNKFKAATSNYLLWDSEAREELFSKIKYVINHDSRLPGSIPKLGFEVFSSVLSKIRSQPEEIGKYFLRSSSNKIYYRRGGLYWKVFVDFATGSSEEKIISLSQDVDKYVVIASLSSNLWFWYLISTSDCRHLGNRDIATFPLSLKNMDLAHYRSLSNLGKEYVEDLKKNAQHTVRRYKKTFDVECLSFRVKESKKIINQIDAILAKHYDFTQEELDFIINYDIKYRMGKELNG
ncbi:Eco57I restriction-modification methylase domain-containing protein [Desulfococcaceae bacterium HSG9]|nr:Eco57I restriction-modification methylase domain-containing protein [Desulfococcaceae bacterium HSG9]